MTTSKVDAGPTLVIENVEKSFGGLKVLTHVSLTVGPGEVLGLIGPNGAGKTTLFNVVTGFLKPSRGRVIFEGEDITARRPDERVRMGVVRTFQKSMVFPDLSVRENLALAVRARAGDGYRLWGGGEARDRADAEAQALLDRAGLGAQGRRTVGALSYGVQRIVDVLVSLAMGPRILLLDEPTAGLSRGEGEHLVEVVRNLAADAALLMIAHDLDIVFGMCDRVAVLDLGRLIACDTPAEIRAHAGAQAAYLGVRESDTAEAETCA